MFVFSHDGMHFINANNFSIKEELVGINPSNPTTKYVIVYYKEYSFSGNYIVMSRHYDTLQHAKQMLRTFNRWSRDGITDVSEFFINC